MKIFNSIRWRLQLWYGLILVLVLVGFGFSAYQLERGRIFRRVDDELHRRVNTLARVLNPPPRGRRPDLGRPDAPPPEQFDEPPENPRGNDRFDPLSLSSGEFYLPPQIANLFDETDSNGFYYILSTMSGKVIARSTNAPANASLLPPPVYRLKSGGKNTLTIAGNAVGEGPPPTPPPAWEHGDIRETGFVTRRGTIVVGRSIARELHDLRFAALKLAGIGGGILLLGLAGGWWLASRAIRPIEDISATAVKISAGDLSQRINTAETESELGKLAGVLNSTFARLETSFALQQQFTADAAHELRTPVSVMLTQTQTSLNRERSAAEYRETLESCQRAAQRMRRLIESLLELARLDTGQEQLKRMKFDLSATVRDCVELIQPLADERGVKIISELAPQEVTGDSERLAQVVTNLLTNAIQYNRIGGEVRVALRLENGLATLTVSDTGVGIAAEDLPHVFERFYRADTSRSGSSGHAGLGLAICKAIVEAHGGTIEVSSAENDGTTFVIKLPL